MLRLLRRLITFVGHRAYLAHDVHGSCRETAILTSNSRKTVILASHSRETAILASNNRKQQYWHQTVVNSNIGIKQS